MKILYVNAITDPLYAEACKSGLRNAFKSVRPEAELISFDIFCGSEKLYSPRRMGLMARSWGVDAVVLSGSSKNTTDREDPWLHEYFYGLRDLLSIQENQSPLSSEYMGPSYPILGICFGHQALACVFGGETARFALRLGKKESRLVGFSGSHPLYKDLIPKKNVSLIYNHSDQVIRVPGGFYNCATSEDCACVSMAHGQWPIMSFQGHPEYSPELLKWNGFQSEMGHCVTPEDLELHDGQKILKKFVTFIQ